MDTVAVKSKRSDPGIGASSNESSPLSVHVCGGLRVAVARGELVRLTAVGETVVTPAAAATVPVAVIVDASTSPGFWKLAELIWVEVWT